MLVSRSPVCITSRRWRREVVDVQAPVRASRIKVGRFEVCAQPRIGDIPRSDFHLVAAFDHRLVRAPQRKPAVCAIASSPLLADGVKGAVAAVAREHCISTRPDDDLAPDTVVDRDLRAVVEDADHAVLAVVDDELLAIDLAGRPHDPLVRESHGRVHPLLLRGHRHLAAVLSEGLLFAKLRLSQGKVPAVLVCDGSWMELL